MKGSAPKSPATGSQVVVAQNPRPNLVIESHDSVSSTTPIAATMTRTRTANAPVPRRKPRSPWLPRRAVPRRLDQETRIFASAAISIFTTSGGSGA